MSITEFVRWAISAVAVMFRLLAVGIRLRLHSLLYSKGSFSYADVFESNCDRYPDQVQFIMAETGESCTKKQVDDLANQVAAWGISQGLKALDSVALMMLNNLSFVSIWLGFAKIGMGTALINTNLTGKPFGHSVETSLKSSDVKIVIVDAELEVQLKADLDELRQNGVKVLIWGQSTLVSKDISLEIKQCTTQRPPKSHRSVIRERDPLLYIFTSGTTGLPKACKISQTRFLSGSYFYPYLCGLDRTDVIYSAMPLYHSAAGIIAAGGALFANVPLVLRKKFSVSAFSSDIIKYNITSIQYIGELCRYLVNAPKNDLDKKIRLKSAIGNGMRVEYWQDFKTRYNVTQIYEFYTATEGNIALFNLFGATGPLGFVPVFLDYFVPFKLVKVNPDDPSQPLRRADNGFCEVCAFNEPGLLIGAINASSKGGDVTRRYDGYTDSKATNDKILKDAFCKGDAYFNTGDLLYRDAYGHYYWSDRVGDTFRWKGENVSTTEVSQALATAGHPIIIENCVYGVSVPNTDGKAGMAAVILEEKMEGLFDGEKLYQECGKHLPVYARPLFLRVKVDKLLPVTSTHKYIKSGLTKEGFDPKLVGEDELWYLVGKKGKYERLTEEVYGKIMSGEIRF